MTTRLYSMRLESEHDIVAARRKSRDASAGLGFSSQDQTRIATSVLEAARTVLLAGTAARADFLVDTDTRPARFVVRFLQAPVRANVCARSEPTIRKPRSACSRHSD